jgi:hypothetical protein
VHAFLDDSGDPGMKLSTGSSRHLVMAACIFRDPEDIEKAATTIRACRDAIPRGERWEFKHARTSSSMKQTFFEAIRPLRFDVRAIVIDKNELYSAPLMSRRGYLQNYAIKQLLAHTAGTLRDAKLVIDGNDSKAFKVSAGPYFLREVNAAVPGTLRKVSCEDSVRNPLIQLADMIAGTIFRHFERPEKAIPLHYAQILGHARYPNGGIWEFAGHE